MVVGFSSLSPLGDNAKAFSCTETRDNCTGASRGARFLPRYKSCTCWMWQKAMQDARVDMASYIIVIWFETVEGLSRDGH